MASIYLTMQYADIIEWVFFTVHPLLTPLLTMRKINKIGKCSFSTVKSQIYEALFEN